MLLDAGDRLASVCAAAGAVALARLDRAHPRVDAATAPAGPVRVAEGGPGMVIVDELGLDGSEVTGRGGTAPDEGSGAGRPSTAAAGVEIAIRDERPAEGPNAWIGSIGRQLGRFKADFVPFAVLLVDLMESEPTNELGTGEGGESTRPSVERLLAAELERVAAERTGRAIGGAVRRQSRGTVTRERAGRYWLVVPAVDRAGARRLAERIAGASALFVTPGGPPPAIGVAMCPDDGRNAASLAAHADVALYAARSSVRGGPRTG